MQDPISCCKNIGVVQPLSMRGQLNHRSLYLDKKIATANRNKGNYNQFISINFVLLIQFKTSVAIGHQTVHCEGNWYVNRHISDPHGIIKENGVLWKEQNSKVTPRSRSPEPHYGFTAFSLSTIIIFLLFFSPNICRKIE